MNNNDDDDDDDDGMSYETDYVTSLDACISEEIVRSV